MNFYEYMFGVNKKEETGVSEKAVCDEVSEKTVKDALVEELEATEKETEDDFNEEDHPRGGKGSKEGGKFVKSEKTKQKEDEVDDIKIDNEEVDPELLDRSDKKLTDEEVIKLKKVAAVTKDPRILKKLAFAERYTSSNSNCEIQEAVANNPNTPHDILRHLSGFPRQNEDYKGKMYNNDVASSAKAMLAKKK